MSLWRKRQAVKFHLQWGREQEDAGACSQSGLISEGTPVDGVFTLSAFSPSRACYFPLLMF